MVPAVILVALTATSIGYAMASLVPPMVANMASQVLVVFILMFSPLNFPADRLPGWLATIHSVLPIQAMGEVMRGTLASNSFPITLGAFALLGAWCVGELRRDQPGADPAGLSRGLRIRGQCNSDRAAASAVRPIGVSEPVSRASRSSGRCSAATSSETMPVRQPSRMDRFASTAGIQLISPFLST